MYQEIEIQTIHPAMAKWLTDNGYEFAHEYLLKQKRRVDFIARNKQGTELLIIECKVTTRLLPRDITQVNLYHEMFNDPTAKKVLAYPVGSVKQKHLNKLTTHGITLIQIEPYNLLEYWDEYGYGQWFNKQLP